MEKSVSDMFKKQPLSAAFKEDLAVAENAFARILGRVTEIDVDEYHRMRLICQSFMEEKEVLETRHED